MTLDVYRGRKTLIQQHHTDFPYRPPRDRPEIQCRTDPSIAKANILRDKTGSSATVLQLRW